MVSNRKPIYRVKRADLVIVRTVFSYLAVAFLLSGCESFFAAVMTPGTALNPDGSVKPTANIQNPTPAFEGRDSQFTVSLSTATSRDVEIHFEVRDGSGVVGLDFPPIIGSVVVPAGNTQATIRIPTIRRVGPQGSRTLIVAITQVDGVSLGSTSATGEIVDIQADEGLFVDLNKAPLNQSVGILNATTVLFFGYSAANGIELWKSDGTASGTVLVKDINPGAPSSMTASMLSSVVWVPYAGKVYFPAFTDTNGWELWSTDGTTGGTAMLTDLAAGTVSGWTSGLLVEHGFLYFVGADSFSSTELYRTDGTAGGTVKITNYAIVNGWSGVSGNLMSINGRIVFRGYCNNSWNFCGYDGNANYTIAGATGNPFYPAPAFNCGGKLFVTGNLNAFLYVTDGTGGGTTQLAAGTIIPLGCSGGEAYFFNNTVAEGFELWKSGGTLGTTAIVKDQVAGAASLVLGSPSPYSYDTARSWIGIDTISAGSRLIYTVNDGTTGYEVYSSNGTLAGTGLLKNIQPGALNGFPGNYYFDASTSQVYFTAEDQTSGTEIWVSDFTSGGTRQLLDVVPGSGGSMATNFMRPGAGAPLFFMGFDRTSGRSRLFKTDGTTAGTVALPADVPNRSSGVTTPRELANGSLILGGDDGSWGAMIWKSLGRPDSLEKIVDLMPNAGCTSITAQIAIGETYYFTFDDSSTGVELWRSDGTATGTMLLKDINAGNVSSIPDVVTKLGNKIIFVASTAAEGRELWVSDGTGFGTTLLKDINTGGVSSTPQFLTAFGSKIVFTATAVGLGEELWITDGTTGGTNLVLDISSGAPSSSPRFMTELGGKILFAASEPANGNELWSTDGTPGGTALLLDIHSGANFGWPTELTKLGNKVIFAADDGVHGAELWSTDGTAVGTSIITDLYTGITATNPGNLRSIGNKIVFTGTHATFGWEIGFTDGTAGGTEMIDVVPGAESPSPQYMTAVGGTVFFVGTTPAHGAELWKTNGTASGTVEVNDLNPGTAGSNPNNLRQVDGILFYTATTPYEGIELHVAHPY